MANFQFITDRLAVGGDCGIGDELPENIQALVDAGITDVIDMRVEWSDEDHFDTYAPSITYHYIPMDDRGQQESIATFQRVCDEANDAFQNPDAKVLVHCHMGINRGPSAAFAIMLSQGYKPVEALQMIRDARDIAGIAYWRDVLRWFFATTDVNLQERQAMRVDCARWMQQNRIDIAGIIRGIRTAEGTKYVQSR